MSSDTPIDLRTIDVPSYFISTVDDHIAPWRTTYLGAESLNAPVRFVLGGSGHIAGIINPPVRDKYGYYTNDNFCKSADEWFAGASQQSGSWWTDWIEWMKLNNSEQKVAARVPGANGRDVIEAAPGRYVMRRIK